MDSLPLPLGSRLLVAISGGRTSMYMAKKIWQEYRTHFDLIFTFANTGLEHSDTYRFLHDGMTALSMPVTWLEARVQQGRRSCTYKVVTPESARRKGEPMWEIMAKYGLPNRTFKHCTRELKKNTMEAYAADHWGGAPYYTAIGIRADERRRVSKAAGVTGIVYPLVDWWPSTKEDVLDDLAQYSWDLRIPEHLGNCVACFQKSEKKLSMVHRDQPAAFDYWRDAERTFENTGPNNRPGPRRIFRGERTVQQMEETFRILNAPLSAHDGGCSESCELYEMEEI